jgi:Rps23 Pro-64 3,4-dihydroxylase Tpa1-like proline 4-hydroxylase
MKTWTEKINYGNGIICYKGVIKKEFDIINKLESNLGSPAPYAELSPEGNPYHWMPAYVGYQQLMPEYRDCYDFKFKKTDIEADTGQTSLNLQAMWQDVYDAQAAAVEDYRHQHNIMDLKYWEAFNFIKYGPGQHFQEHHDHGFSYNCTVSLVAYVNDDYEGGELFFRLQDLTIKPEAGDLIIFPSNFMYPHRAMPVHSGTKYSIVTMLDYNKKFHTQDMYVADTD